MVLGAASRRPLSAVSGNRSVHDLPRAQQFEKKGKRGAEAEEGKMPVEGDNLAGKGDEKKETALTGTAGADAEAAPECECGEEAKLTSAKKASGETRFYWLCSKGETFTSWHIMANPSHRAHSRINTPLLPSQSNHPPASSSAPPHTIAMCFFLAMTNRHKQHSQGR
jgi:hypothetical protein